MTTKTFAADYENDARLFWDSFDACAEASGCPDVADFARAFGSDDRVEVEEAKVPTITAWLETVPGWRSGPAHAPTALVIADEE